MTGSDHPRGCTPDFIRAAALAHGWHVHRRRRGYEFAYRSDRLKVHWDKHNQLRHATLDCDHPVTEVHRFDDLTDRLQISGLLRSLARHPDAPTVLDLVAHLAEGRELFVPGGGHHGDPVGPYSLVDRQQLRYHPLNPAQLPVIPIEERGGGRTRFVSAVHLAHAQRDGCCSTVWATAAEHWDELADLDHDGEHPMIFGLHAPTQLLVHIDDLPPAWFGTD